MAVRPIKQPELFEPAHESFSMDRIGNMPERVYLDAWQSLNVRSPGLNRGFTYLEHILCPKGLTPGPVSARDAAVAASVIQWLGTNCGMAFIHGCERKIGSLRVVEDAKREREFKERLESYMAATARPAPPPRPKRLYVED